MHRPSGIAVVTTGLGALVLFHVVWSWGTRRPEPGRSRACRRRARHSTQARPSSCIQGPGAPGPPLPRQRRGQRLSNSPHRKQRYRRLWPHPSGRHWPPPRRGHRLRPHAECQFSRSSAQQSRRRRRPPTRPGRAARTACEQGGSRVHPASHRRADGSLRAGRGGDASACDPCRPARTGSPRRAASARTRPGDRRRRTARKPSSGPRTSGSWNATAFESRSPKSLMMGNGASDGT